MANIFDFNSGGLLPEEERFQGFSVNATPEEIHNNDYVAMTQYEVENEDNYWSALKDTIPSTPFDPVATTALNLDNEQDNIQSGLKSALGFVINGAMMFAGGAPLAVAAGVGAYSAGELRNQDKARSMRQNQYNTGMLKDYLPHSAQNYIMSGNKQDLVHQFENNPQARTVQQQLKTFKDQGDEITYLFNPVSGSMEEVGRNQIDTGTGGTGRDAKAFAGGATSFEDSEGNRTTLYRMDDGSFRDADNRPVSPIAQGLTPVNQTNIDLAKSIMGDNTATPAQKDWAAGVLREDDLRSNERGLMTPASYDTYVEDVYQTQTDIAGLDASLEVLKVLSESDASRIGQGTVNTINRYLEPMGLSLGEDELRRFYQSSEADRLELVAGLVRAFAPVSDTAMNLVQDSLKGKTFEQTYEAVEATRRRLARNYNGLLDRGKAMQVGGEVSELEAIDTVPTFNDNRSDEELLNMY